MAAVASSAEKRLATTAETVVLRIHVNTAGNFAVYVYARTIAATDLDVTVTWADGSGAKSATVLSGPQGTGSSMGSPLQFNAVAGTPILVTGTASVANVASVSATVKAL